MSGSTKQVAVLGSTGSIGTSTLDVLASSQGRLQVAALSAHASTERLYQQLQTTQPRWVVISSHAAELGPCWRQLPSGCELLRGPEALEQVASAPEVDVVVAAIVGVAGLRSTWAALAQGKTVALANKETLVVAGARMMDLARQTGAALIPVDSEHSALFQCLQAGRRAEVKRMILTASGGPFLRRPLAELEQVTASAALRHPTWNMGPKVTIDSATMMNKALEIVEARWLFDLAPDQIQVMIHPQSIIHSLVEFVDGSVLAQLSPPDMKLPIQYALTYPERQPCTAPCLDWSQAWDLRLEPPDPARFPALDLGLEVARAGGTAGAVVNAANEVAVARFLTGELKFTDIVPTCRRVLETHNFDPNPTLEALLQADRWARQEVLQWACS